jgi:hypothetical protein
MNVLVAHEKHGLAVYLNALPVVRARLAEGYWYREEDKARAEVICDQQNEAAARRFIDERSDHEYELCEWVPVHE